MKRQTSDRYSLTRVCLTGDSLKLSSSTAYSYVNIQKVKGFVGLTMSLPKAFKVMKEGDEASFRLGQSSISIEVISLQQHIAVMKFNAPRILVLHRRIRTWEEWAQDVYG